LAREVFTWRKKSLVSHHKVDIIGSDKKEEPDPFDVMLFSTLQ